MASPYDFQFTGGPIDDPPSATEAWIALGHAAAAWARLEQQIDALLIHINKPMHSEKLYDPDHPVSFSKKIDLLKRWFNKHPPLKDMSSDMRQLTSRLKVLGRDRNLFLHSIVDAYDNDTKKVSLRSIKYEGTGKFRLSHRTVHIKTIATFCAVTVTANKFLWSMSSQLFTPDGLKRLRTV